MRITNGAFLIFFSFLSIWLISSLATAAIPLGSSENEKPKKATLTLLSAPENRGIEKLVKAAAKKENIDLKIEYKNSPAISNSINDESIDVNAVWPMHSHWLSFNDTASPQHPKSIYRTPMVLAVKASVAQKNGWISKAVSLNDILTSIVTLDTNLSMASPISSDPGAITYAAIVRSISQDNQVADPTDQKVVDGLTKVLLEIGRTSVDSSGLTNLLVENYASLDGMFNYESEAIQANLLLKGKGQEQLYVIYPSDGMTIADAPLAFNKGTIDQEQALLRLQKRLLGEDFQKEILKSGRRTNPIGLGFQGADEALFDPRYGFDSVRIIPGSRFPNLKEWEKIKGLYLQKRSGTATVFCLDFSGGTTKEIETKLRESMRLLLDPREAEKRSLTYSPSDITSVLIFDSKVRNSSEVNKWTIYGNEDAKFAELSRMIDSQNFGGNTNIYSCVSDAYRLLGSLNASSAAATIIVLSDGRSTVGSMDQVRQAINDTGLKDVPVMGILLEEKTPFDVEFIASVTNGQLFSSAQSYLDWLKSTGRFN